MRTNRLVLILVLAAGVAHAAPSPSPAPAARIAPDASDIAALTAYQKDPKNPSVLFDYVFSMLHLERYPEAHKALDEWRAVAPGDPMLGDVSGLLEKLEREPDAKKREQVATDWAMAQRKAARTQHDEIRQNMQKMSEGLAEMSKEEAAHGPAALPALKAKAEKTPSADNWLAYSDALITTSDFKGALEAAKAAAKLDPAHVLAALSVSHLSRYDGKNGDEIKQAIRKERINQVLKALGP